MIEEKIAYCGLICEECPAYLATREKDPQKRRKLRAKIASICNKLYKLELTAEDINDCDGCFADTDRIFSGCLNCEIRKCAIEKGVKNCAYCEEYPCSKLDIIFKSEPEAKKRLDKKKVVNRK